MSKIQRSFKNQVQQQYLVHNEYLCEKFSENSYPKINDYEEMSYFTGIPTLYLKTWFANRRSSNKVERKTKLVNMNNEEVNTATNIMPRNTTKSSTSFNNESFSHNDSSSSSSSSSSENDNNEQIPVKNLSNLENNYNNDIDERSPQDKISVINHVNQISADEDEEKEYNESFSSESNCESNKNNNEEESSSSGSYKYVGTYTGKQINNFENSKKSNNEANVNNFETNLEDEKEKRYFSQIGVNRDKNVGDQRINEKIVREVDYLLKGNRIGNQNETVKTNNAHEYQVINEEIMEIKEEKFEFIREEKAIN